jgi:hypothetical protein
VRAEPFVPAKNNAAAHANQLSGAHHLSQPDIRLGLGRPQQLGGVGPGDAAAFFRQSQNGRLSTCVRGKNRRAESDSVTSRIPFDTSAALAVFDM